MSLCESFYKGICCIVDPVFPNPYTFEFGETDRLNRNKQRFESNFVRTSKYRWFDFIPKALILQFYRLANIFFLVIAVLQTISVISPLNPLTAWAPLIIVLGISMVREGYEDYQRYKSDVEMNHEYKTQVFRDGRFVEVEWQEVLVGDICRVTENNLFPADLILLVSEHSDGNAFIETASLDGEKNLKPRASYPQTQILSNEEALSSFLGRWQGIVPDKNTENFQSSLFFRSVRINYKKQKQLLWRGTRLMNTKWIYGLAIYTGRNTKIMMNSDAHAEKMSQIEVKVNFILGIILLIQVALSVLCGILSGIFTRDHKSVDTYIQWSYQPVIDGILHFFTYFVLINTMIPISLIVSIEIVKMTQSYFINNDQFMYSDYRKKGALVRSASLNEELGQIEHIFSDKTGTLTTNRMEFKIAAIGTHLYGDIKLIQPKDQDDDFPVKEQIVGFKDDDLKKMLLSPDTKHNAMRDVYVKDREKQQTLTFNSIRALAGEYFTALALAHEVIPQKDDKTGKVIYQGPSPDEITLVDAARQMHFQFVKSTQSTTAVKIRDEVKTFELLETFPFNSDRKRMSIVVKDNGVIKMYSKGADSIIQKRLARDQTFNLDDELTKFSVIGLRTLMIAMRLISEKEYQEFKDKVNHLPIENRQKLYDDLVSELENQLYLIGATAVLDRLQDEVPQTIRDMIRANIKVWMLTGDKMETAENIAKSCNLIQRGFEVLKCSFPERTDQGILNSMTELRIQAEELFRQGTRMTFMLEGTDLAEITKGEDELKDHLIAIAEKCQSVVCCRLLPIQKAEIVKIVRQKLNKITLAIGDGANDVPMIKAAHIGIGLFGEEGMAAVQGSDYALPEFRMLWRLLLVHGRWNYMRIAQMILYFFYKNMLFTFPQFLFAFYCGYSGQTIFEDNYVSLYNLAFTSVPLVIRALFQQDVYYLTKMRSRESMAGDESANYFRATQLRLTTAYTRFIPKGYVVNKYLYRLFPKLYYIGQDNCIFNYRNFFFWVLEGIAEAILIFFFAIYILSTQSVNGSGRSSDMWLVSLTIYSIVVMVVTFKLATHTKHMSCLSISCLFLFALGTYIAYLWISNYYISSFSFLGTTIMFFSSGQTYFLIIFGTCLVLLLDGLVLSLDYDNSGLLKRLRNLIDEQKQFRLSEYEKHSIKISIGTVIERNLR